MIRADFEANCGRRAGGPFALALAYFVVPGFRVMVRHRLAARLRTGRIGRLVTKLAWLANTRQGVYISPASRIGRGLRLPHPTMIVIGDGVRIGDRVTIYQGVTLGRKSDRCDDYPMIGSNVVIYAGATIVGAVCIGEGAVIGAHALVRADVPPRAIVVGPQGHIVKREHGRSDGGPGA